MIRAISVILLATAASCAVSDDEERQMGAEYARQINEQVPLVTDPRVTGYVSALGRQIAQRTSRGSLDWQFHVVNSREVNAFALPGGFIYVNRGLIERSRTLDHLAGVLGHEIGHVVERHSVERMKKSTGTNIGLAILCTVTSICEGAIGQVAVSAAGSALLAKYSRGDEAEADSQAVANVMNAGISPLGIPEFFEVLMSERRRDPTVYDNFFASHPVEESRVERTRALISELDQSRVQALTRDDPGFHTFKALVSALPPAPRPHGAPPLTPSRSKRAHPIARVRHRPLKSLHANGLHRPLTDYIPFNAYTFPAQRSCRCHRICDGGGALCEPDSAGQRADRVHVCSCDIRGLHGWRGVRRR